ncbi:MAG: DUF4163 domain-containing protein [Clostridiales bacterium]|nr:DUF4163 domain-containing protein [Clostridiales bacterium]
MIKKNQFHAHRARPAKHFSHIERKAALVCALALSAAILATGCKKKESEDLTSTHTTAAETATEETAAETVGAELVLDTSADSQNTGSSTETYTSGKVSIQYPVIHSLEDADLQEKVNALLKEHALAVIDGYGIDETTDSLDVTCRILSADRSRIVVIFRGSCTTDDGDTTRIFYSSTIDASSGEGLRLTHYADPATLADYVLSDQVVFPEASADEKEGLMSEKNTQKKSFYTKLFQNADFSGSEDFPQSFSYEYEGDIYFSIPVSHELGDYAIAVYTPENK